jgi:hypothetical protein
MAAGHHAVSRAVVGHAADSHAARENARSIQAELEQLRVELAEQRDGFARAVMINLPHSQVEALRQTMLQLEMRLGDRQRQLLRLSEPAPLPRRRMAVRASATAGGAGVERARAFEPVAPDARPHKAGAVAPAIIQSARQEDERLDRRRLAMAAEARAAAQTAQRRRLLYG